MLFIAVVMTTWQHRVNLQLPTCIKPNLTILINKSVCFLQYKFLLKPFWLIFNYINNESRKIIHNNLTQGPFINRGELEIGA